MSPETALVETSADAWKTRVVDEARDRGWPSHTSRNGDELVDLLLIRHGRVVVAHLTATKSGLDRSGGNRRFRCFTMAPTPGPQVTSSYVWGPDDWDQIEETLQ